MESNYFLKIDLITVWNRKTIAGYLLSWPFHSHSFLFVSELKWSTDLQEKEQFVGKALDGVNIIGLRFNLTWSILMQQHKPMRKQSQFGVNAAHLGVRQYGAVTMQGVTLPLLHCSSALPSGMVFVFHRI